MVCTKVRNCSFFGNAWQMSESAGQLRRESGIFGADEILWSKKKHFFRNGMTFGARSTSCANSWKKETRKDAKESASWAAFENCWSSRRRYTSASEVHDSKHSCHSWGRMFRRTVESGNGANWGNDMFPTVNLAERLGGCRIRGKKTQRLLATVVCPMRCHHGSSLQWPLYPFRH